MCKWPGVRIFTYSSGEKAFKTIATLRADPANNIEAKWIASDEATGTG